MRRLAVTTTTLALALVVAGCSSDDDASQTDATTGADRAAAADSSAGEDASESGDEAGDSEGDGTQSSAKDKKSSKDKPKPQQGAPVPDYLDFQASTLTGARFQGASLAAEDAVVFFWAPWCTKCLADAPTVASLAAEFDGRADVLGVAGLSSDSGAKQDFVARTGSEDMTHLDDSNGDIYTSFGVVSQHTYAFIDDSGSIEVLPGPLSAEELRQRLQTLISS
jgi:thiol-disulfide isomerase/thioredoxin